MSSNTTRERTHPNTESDVTISGEPEIRLQIEFGGHCRQCDRGLDAFQADSEFGRLICRGCGLVLGPVIKAYGVDTGAEVNAVGWVDCSPFDLQNVDATVYQRRKGRCECGGELGENTEEVRFGSVQQPGCVECGATPALSTQWNVIEQGDHDLDAAEQTEDN